MNKTFLYLYPIEEFFEIGKRLDYRKNREFDNALTILNRTIEKRYKNNDYEIVVVQYPNKPIFGIEQELIDRVLFTDVTFEEATIPDRSNKAIEDVKYPSVEKIFDDIGNVNNLIIGGFHFSDCVKKVGEYFHSKNIDTIVDLELTDLFFNTYFRPYFSENNYSPENFKKRFLEMDLSIHGKVFEEQFNRTYSSPIYKMPIKQRNNDNWER